VRQKHNDGTAVILDDGIDVLLDDGYDVAEEYGFPIPRQMDISDFFGLARTDGDKTNGFLNPPEWSVAGAYPRGSAYRAARYLADQKHPDDMLGSALLRLSGPDGTGAGRFLVTGAGREVEGSEPMLVRYALLSLLHAFGKEGLPGVPERVHELPRIDLRTPQAGDVLHDPASTQISWALDWSRWDGRKYNDGFSDGFAEDESDIVYVLMVSTDFGETWRNLRDGAWAFEGELPLLNGVPDPARTIPDAEQGGVQTWTWSLPAVDYPAGTYIVRVEAHRISDPLHYAYRTERVDVKR
jgi:hypothetical protein